MGYSSPKKQLDLKEFLNTPGTPNRFRNRWARTATPPVKDPETEKPEAEVAEPEKD
ncbi:MAG: hypothetical protein RIE24_22600 [Silicimonas sp.]